MSKIIKLNVTGRESVVWLENQKLKAAIERVRELHVPVNDGGCGDPECCSPGGSEDFCFVCQGYEYPCDTIKALDGEQ